MYTYEENQIIERALEVLESKRLFTSYLDSTEIATRAVLTNAQFEHEVFTVYALTSQYQLIESKPLFHGTINASQVYVREIVKYCLSVNAAAVILSHNHPSGCVDPSDSDRSMTQKIIQALKFIDIQVLDHIITGHGKSFSFAEKGML